MWCSVEGLELYSREGRAGEGHSPLHPTHYTLLSAYSTLHTLHSNLHTPHSHSTLHKLQTPHSTNSTLHKLQTPHSTLHKLHTPHSTLHTPHSRRKELVAEYGRGELCGIVETLTGARRSTTLLAVRSGRGSLCCCLLLVSDLQSAPCSLHPALCFMASWHICFMASWHLSRHLGILPSVLLTCHLPRDTEIAKIPAGLINSIKLKYPMVVSR